MNNITVTIAYAKSNTQQFLREVSIPMGSTIAQVIEASGVVLEYPDINLEVNKVGIASQVLPLNTIVQAGDRIEIYRPLIFDPMQARRLRAKGLAPAQHVLDADLRQKTPLNDVVPPVRPFVVVDKHNPSDQTERIE